MRKSLSEKPQALVVSAILLSAVLAVAAVIDQVGRHSLSDHATAMYAPHGKDPDPSLLYGLLYAVAVVGGLLWLAALRSARSGSRFAPVVSLVMVAITATLALTLLGSSEYGSPIFPPLWGVLAALPPAAGVVAAVLQFRRR